MSVQRAVQQGEGSTKTTQQGREGGEKGKESECERFREEGGGWVRETSSHPQLFLQERTLPGILIV